MFQIKAIAEVPKEVKRFLVYAAVLFVVWKSVYLLWLQPTQLLDRPLVKAIAAQTTTGLNWLTTGSPFTYEMLQHQVGYNQLQWGKSYVGSFARIFREGKRSLVIVPSCDALELMVLYVGFIACFPTALRKKWIPAIGGVIAIHIVNVLRCIALVLLYHSSWSRFFDFTHHYLFTMTIYLFIFLLWVWFVKFSGPQESSIDVHAS